MYQRSNSKNPGRYVISLFGGLALVAVSYYGVNQHPRPEHVAQATPDQLPASRGPGPASINADSQASPQGPTGPIETKSGGAPASSPQGDTPSGMQAAPQGSDKAIRSPSK
jgi:hypothetical protein